MNKLKKPDHQYTNIKSHGTRRLAAHIRIVRQRDPATHQQIAAVRRGDNEVLHRLVTRAPNDADAALAAVCGLLPRLCSIIINRLPVTMWQASIDDYINLAYLTIIDLPPTTDNAYLADKIIASTRRRHERMINARQPTPSEQHELETFGPATNTVEQQVVARIELTELGDALADGLVSKKAWRTLIATKIDIEPGATFTTAQHQLARRAQTRLTGWRDLAA